MRIGFLRILHLLSLLGGLSRFRGPFSCVIRDIHCVFSLFCFVSLSFTVFITFLSLSCFLVLFTIFVFFFCIFFFSFVIHDIYHVPVSFLVHDIHHALVSFLVIHAINHVLHSFLFRSLVLLELAVIIISANYRILIAGIKYRPHSRCVSPCD